MSASGLSRLLFGADPKLRRMMFYWSATAALYTVFMGLLVEVGQRGLIDRGDALGLTAYAGGGIVLSYLLVRLGARHGLAPTGAAALQAVFGITCNMWAYVITGPFRAATLMGLMVVVVFCTFALRPRQTLALTAVGLVGMGTTMWWHQLHDPAHYPPLVEAVTFAIMAGCSLAVTVLTGEASKLRARLKAQKEDLVKALDTIRILATVDELTALSNRRHMNEMLAEEERRHVHGAGSPDRETCIALLDIDFFKQINDRHGHAAGDEVLRSFAAAARAELRANDVLARWGGEEFLLMLPDTGEAAAKLVVERIRARVGRLLVDGVTEERGISFSAGLTARRGAEALADTVNRADKALYQAKSSGRDRVIVA
ncbi:Response regulator PleD [Massilia sp. Bi118]|uniref:diguanylate cyclase n=1 Tax=Massilia sp. Bi118 TaxID=2822346 RepID=UPI001D667CBF|nr:diguanylate cyclase [Massilia sp. Bi118]CAH0258010.1 Response regulator PleD [Massilia sp. Bi118]